MTSERYYCRICDRWFLPQELANGMMHPLLVSGPGIPAFHVVMPEPEALALLRDRKDGEHGRVPLPEC